MDNIKTENQDNKNIDYQFVAVPLNLFCRLDNNLRSMLFTLIQLQTYYSEEDGWFFRSNADLAAQSNLSENLVRITIDTLYKEGLIDVKSVGKGKGTNSPSNRFKVNWERFKDYEKDDIEKCIKDPRLEIKTPKYKGSHYHPSYLDKNNGGSKPHDKTEGEDKVDCGVMVADTTLVEDEVDSKVNNGVTNMVKVEDNIYNINNIDNKDNIKNVYNIENKKNKENILNNTLNNNIHDNISFFDCSRVVERTIGEYQLDKLIDGFSKTKDSDSIIEHFKEVTRFLNHFPKEKHASYIDKIRIAITQRCEELEIDTNEIFNYFN